MGLNEGEHATLGLGQAKEYAKSLNVPFVFSTNGHLFVAYDSFSEKVTGELPIGSFPEPELLKRDGKVIHTGTRRSGYWILKPAFPTLNHK